MNDKTIVKPRPGRGAGGGNKPANKEAPADDGKTVFEENSGESRAQNSILTIAANPLVDCAGTLLSICAQIRNTEQHEDIKTLKVQCIELIKHYEQLLRSHNINTEDIQSARYCLCSFLDETVLNTPWGGNSLWASDSLLSTFHNEAFGGEYFYTLLEAALQNPAEKHPLLELMYLCLSLGFVGKMRIEDQGEKKLEDLRDKCYQAVQSFKGDNYRELSPGWRDRVVQHHEFQHPFPLWVIGALFGVLLLFIYMAFSYNINNYSSNVYKQLVSLVPWQQVGREDLQSLSRDEALMLQQLLQTEIQRQLLDVEQLPDRVRIRIGAGVLFSSGSTQPRADFEAILAKIARTLESTDGKILITGHTDDDPIFTTKYPSNWHLSLARATAIGNFLANNASLSGRLWPEGRGESEPRVENTSDQNRSLNRRIEIDLLF
ncbi:type VI secretion system protein TssL, long form [Thalassomonas actiniarum]|uniref:Type VI secretion system protein TssL n=1 Tax=Thalassomonas actiniarum TaxID=485447 RepID=A0AAE9YV66_9GAMM|nr:type VI secretion system protein TssL, long form [Thalassomonas actiniarum]WDE01177.1 type VI secretion system protein TssL [Thalassomonas actiniarum]